MAKTLIYHRKVEQDFEQAIDFYTKKSKALGNKFYHELVKAYGHISVHPAIDLNCFSYELNILNLKTWELRDFPYIIFYIEKADHIHIYHVLHNSQQISLWMFEP